MRFYARRNTGGQRFALLGSVALMPLAPPRAATCVARVATGLALLLAAAPVAAEGGPPLVLPLVAALTVASAASGLPGMGAANDSRHRELLRFLPKQLQIPDGYADADEDFIDVDRSYEPVNADRIVWLNLFPKPKRGWMPVFAYDEEVRGPHADTDDVLRVYVEHRF
jgi:hypothetical protein